MRTRAPSVAITVMKATVELLTTPIAKSRRRDESDESRAYHLYLDISTTPGAHVVP
jgi:hypothetical protein